MVLRMVGRGRKVHWRVSCGRSEREPWTKGAAGVRRRTGHWGWFGVWRVETRVHPMHLVLVSGGPSHGERERDWTLGLGKSLALTCCIRNVSIQMEMSNWQLDVWVRISNLNHRGSLPSYAQVVWGCLLPKGVLLGPSAAWAICLGWLGGSSVFLILIWSESLPGIPDVFT